MFRVLPRYRFVESGVGCEAHSNPTCLCDVHVTDPVVVQSDVPLMFEQAILDELGEHGANERNVHEIASVLLGLYETYVDSGADISGDAENAEHAVTPRISNLLNNSLFDQLDERTVRALRAHYRAGSPWEIAVLELGDGWSADNLRTMRQAYVNRVKQSRNDKRYRLQAETSVPTVVECMVCGKVVRNVRGRRMTCSSACKQVAYRRRKNEVKA